MAVNISENYNDLCRICSVKTSVLVGLNIFSSEGVTREINKKIALCLPIQVHLEDELPKMICSQCIYKLDLFCDFRQRSLETEQMLISTLKGFRECALNETNAQIVQVQPQSDLIYHGNDTTEEQALLALSEYVPSHDFNPHPISIKNDYLECKVEIVGDDSSLNSNGHLTTQIGMQNDPLGDNFNTNSSTSSSESDLNNHLVENVDNTNLTQWTNLTTSEDLSNVQYENSEANDTNFTEYHQEQESNLPPPGSYYVSAGPTPTIFNTTIENSEIKTVIEEEQKNEVEFEIKFYSQKPSTTCGVCGKSFKTNYKLKEHEKIHTDEKPFHCSTCNKVFRSRIGLMQHEAAHTGEYAYTCEQCGKGFQCRSYLQVHQRAHDTNRPHSCDQCGAGFKTKQALQDHVNRHLGVKPFKCNECERAFVTKGLLKGHERSHERKRATEQGDIAKANDALHPCSVCNKRFVSKSYLQTHMRIHNNDRRHICETCGKRFLTPVDLRIHLTMHTGEKKYLCQQCGKAFARRDALRCHLRSHSGERPYTCPTCGQSFTQYSPMAIHMRLHTGQRPYSCEKCQRTFVSKSGMLVHLRKHENSTNLPNNVGSNAVNKSEFKKDLVDVEDKSIQTDKLA